MKFVFTFILFISFVIPVLAQTDQTWSDEIKYNCNVLKTLPKDQNSYYIVTSVGSSFKDLRLLYFNHGVLKHENAISPRTANALNRIEDIYILDDQLQLFFSEESALGSKLYVQKINEQCQAEGSPILLKEQEIKGGLSSKEIQYYINTSPNRKFVSISYLFNHSNVFEFPELVTTIYDHNLVKLKEERIKTEYYLSRMSLENIKITNNGTVLTLMQGYQTPSNSKLKYNALDLYKNSLNASSEHKQLEKGELSFFNPTIIANNDSILTIAYQYNTIGKWRPNEGAIGVIFYDYFTKTDSLNERSELLFDKNELIAKLTVKEKKLYDKETARNRPYNLALFRNKIRDLYTLQDSSRLLTLEESWSDIRTYNTGRYMNSYTVYNYNNITLMKYDAQLVKDYSVVVPKYQISKDDNGFYSSFSQHISADGHLYLMFNDNISNYFVSGDFNQTQNLQNFTLNINKFCTALVDLDIKTGLYKRRALFDKDDIENLFVPRLYEQDLYYNTHILTFNKRNRYRFVKIVF